MVDVGVAIAWIGISAVSVIGLSAYARAAAISGANAELASFAFYDTHDSEDVYAISAHPRPPAVSVGGLTNAAAGDVDAAWF